MTSTENRLDPAERVRRFDIYSDETLAHLDSTLAYARSACPVARSEANEGYYLVSTYDLIREVLADPGTYSSRDGISQPVRQLLPMPPINSDPPEHGDFRRLLNPFFSRAGLAPSEDAIRRIAAALLDQVIDRGEMEFLDDFAAPLTSGTLCRVILNLADDSMATEAMHRVEAIGETNDASAWQELTTFLTGLLNDGGDPPAGGNRSRDLLASIRGGVVGDRTATREEKLGVLIILFLGGLDTTRAAMGSIVRHMIADPSLEERMLDPGWVTRDLDEMLRHDSVVTALARTITHDTELGGQPLRAGERIVCHYYSANHDEARFEQPDRLMFDRQRNPHIAFGVGVHRCLGSNLARLQIKVGFEELLARITNIRLARPDADIRPLPGMTRIPRSMPIVFTRR